EQFGAGSKANSGPSKPPEWLPEVYNLAEVPAALGRVGFGKEDIAKLSAENWLRVYAANFG
ncbi:peptidase M19, partial [Rhizobiaceae sp. 2RAB30]